LQVHTVTQTPGRAWLQVWCWHSTLLSSPTSHPGDTTQQVMKALVLLL
jgi:hypothetical protein